jgi:hypothetical protein
MHRAVLALFVTALRSFLVRAAEPAAAADFIVVNTKNWTVKYLVYVSRYPSRNLNKTESALHSLRSRALIHRTISLESI